MLKKTWYEENEPFGFLFYGYRVVMCWIAAHFGTVTARLYRRVTPFVDWHWYSGHEEIRRGIVHWNSSLLQETTWSIFGRVVSTSEEQVEGGHISTTWVERDDVTKPGYLESVTNFLEKKANPEGYETTGAIAKHGVHAMAEKSAAWLSRESNEFSW